MKPRWDGARTLANDKRFELSLVFRAGEDLGLDRVGGESEHEHGVLLSDAMCTVHRLQIRLGIPVRVEEDHGVRRGEGDSNSPGASGKEENLAVCPGVSGMQGAMGTYLGDRWGR